MGVCGDMFVHVVFSVVSQGAMATNMTSLPLRVSS